LHIQKGRLTKANLKIYRIILVGAANALSRPPGEYGRKIKTQMN